MRNGQARDKRIVSVLCSTPHSKQPSKWVSCVLSTLQQGFHSWEALASFQHPSFPRVRHFLAGALTTWATAVGQRVTGHCPRNPVTRPIQRPLRERVVSPKLGKGKGLTLTEEVWSYSWAWDFQKRLKHRRERQGDNCGCVLGEVPSGSI